MPVECRQVSQWQNSTPEKSSWLLLGASVCRAAPQWQEMVMELCAESMVGRVEVMVKPEFMPVNSGE
jgi:hypothetical protein